MNLTQKETDLIKDLKGQEKLCTEKYSKSASTASDTQLKNLFNHIAKVEQQHLDTLTQIENGTIPQQGGGAQNKPTFTATYSSTDSAEKQNDCYLCTDLLTTEKHASHLYDMSVFEFKNDELRNVLNHIQKEEQEHGKLIYDYMQTNSMYA